MKFAYIAINHYNIVKFRHMYVTRTYMNINKQCQHWSHCHRTCGSSSIASGTIACLSENKTIYPYMIIQAITVLYFKGSFASLFFACVSV